MLRLILFRHAHADRPREVTDHERPLSERGQEQAQQMGKLIQSLGLVPDLVIVSSAKRTQQTWATASAATEISVRKVDEPRVYESTAGDLLEVLREQDSSHACIMLVGHNPGLERLAAWLIDSGEPIAMSRLQREFVVGGIAVIDFQAQSWAELDVQSGKLQRFEIPNVTA